MYTEIKNQTRIAVCELLAAAKLSAGDLFVIGCSSSEILGEQIGKGGSQEAAQAVFDGIYPVLQEAGVYLVAQCCEHLNRALILEREAACRYGFEEVCVRPQPKAGGSFAAICFDTLVQPVAVERIAAHAGIDIGGTLIGMHLRPVAVPVRLSVKAIGCAPILCARTRPKFIGGSRAIYE